MNINPYQNTPLPDDIIALFITYLSPHETYLFAAACQKLQQFAKTKRWIINKTALLGPDPWAQEKKFTKITRTAQFGLTLRFKCIRKEEVSHFLKIFREATAFFSQWNGGVTALFQLQGSGKHKFKRYKSYDWSLYCGTTSTTRSRLHMEGTLEERIKDSPADKHYYRGDDFYCGNDRAPKKLALNFELNAKTLFLSLPSKT